ncbi:MAG TPA: hypothetical protein VL595_05050 [Pseudonocardia sp.]|jgi:Mce-associated membrane protein|nr:hypothetical protein [Pseudonocardia sp.]
MSPELPDPAGTEPSDDQTAKPVGEGEAAGGTPAHESEQPVAAQEGTGSAPSESAPPAAAQSAAPQAGTAAAPKGQTGTRRLTALAVAAVLLIAVAVLLAFENHSARANGPLANEAFVDTSSTTEVETEMAAAIKTVYSYDYRSLDANRAAAKEVITGQFAQDFDKVFDAVKQLAPKEQAVMTTDVAATGVLQLKDDRARLLMMVDQKGTKAGSQPIGGASARLVVVAQKVDGHWKIAEVTPE